MEQALTVSPVQPAMEKYTKLLMKRDQYKKDAQDILTRYIRTFGQLMTAVFEKKILCIEKKKAIAFCQMLENRGKPVLAEDLQKYLEKVMQAYNQELGEMKEDVENAENAAAVSLYDVQKIKHIYRKLAKGLHPDLHPEIVQEDGLLELWSNIQLAYEHNDLKGMEELEVIAEVLLKDETIELKVIPAEILEEKIQEVQEEIEEILSTDPYIYRFLLEDEIKTEERIQELKQELRQYEEYAKELNIALAKYDIRETKACLVS